MIADAFLQQMLMRSREYGVDGLYVGVPAVIGAGGVEKILRIALTDAEKAAFAKTVEAVRQSVREVKL